MVKEEQVRRLNWRSRIENSMVGHTRYRARVERSVCVCVCVCVCVWCVGTTHTFSIPSSIKVVLSFVNTGPLAHPTVEPPSNVCVCVWVWVGVGSHNINRF